MPGVYRVEISKGSRAGCQNKECKDAQIKIQKGELRFGTFVTIQEHQTWRWKHWGCVTPVQLYNVKDSVEGDPERFLDGYAELEGEDKAKIATAVEEGHVADEDWRGDIEVNRPGEKGFRTPASKKKAKEEARAQAQENGDESPSKTAEKKKRGRPKKEADVDSGDEPPAKKPKAEARTSRKIKIEDDLDEEPQPKKRGKKASKSDVKDESSREIKVEADEDSAPAPPAKKRGAARKAAPQKFKDEESEDEGGRVGLSANADEGNGEDEEVAEEAPKPKRGRKPKVKKVEDNTAPPSTGNAKSKQKKAADFEPPTESKRSGGRTTRSSVAES